VANGSGVNPVNRKNPMGKELHPETLQRVAMLIQEKAEMMRCLPDDMNVTKDTLIHVLECLVDILINRAEEARDMCLDELCTDEEELH
jgi:hypothetical protein